jgi:hypothetical protein
LGHQNRFTFPGQIDELMLGNDQGGGRDLWITRGDVDDDNEPDWRAMTLKSDFDDEDEMIYIIVWQQQQPKSSKRSGACNKNFIRFGRAGGASSRSRVIGSSIDMQVTTWFCLILFWDRDIFK